MNPEVANLIEEYKKELHRTTGREYSVIVNRGWMKIQPVDESESSNTYRTKELPDFIARLKKRCNHEHKITLTFPDPPVKYFGFIEITEAEAKAEPHVRVTAKNVVTTAECPDYALHLTNGTATIFGLKKVIASAKFEQVATSPKTDEVPKIPDLTIDQIVMSEKS